MQILHDLGVDLPERGPRGVDIRRGDLGGPQRAVAPDPDNPEQHPGPVEPRFRLDLTLVSLVYRRGGQVVDEYVGGIHHVVAPAEKGVVLDTGGILGIQETTGIVGLGASGRSVEPVVDEGGALGQEFEPFAQEAGRGVPFPEDAVDAGFQHLFALVDGVLVDAGDLPFLQKVGTGGQGEGKQQDRNDLSHGSKGKFEVDVVGTGTGIGIEFDPQAADAGGGGPGRPARIARPGEGVPAG